MTDFAALADRLAKGADEAARVWWQETFGSDEVQFVTMRRDGDQWLMNRYTRDVSGDRERERTVAWLRKSATEAWGEEATAYARAADAIENGDHLK